MRTYEIKPSLRKILKKVAKRDKGAFEHILKKIGEVMKCEDVNHYKNLRKPLQHLKRIHIKKSFVMTFEYDQAKDKVIFYAFDHHDNIYQ